MANGLVVSASATFTFTNGALVITLRNLGETDSAGQLLSGVVFSLSDVGPIVLASNSAHTVQVESSGAVTDVSINGTADWGVGVYNSTQLPTFNGEYIVCAVCNSVSIGTGVVAPNQPKLEILGLGGGSAETPFSTANASIKGNGGNSHEPFVLESATFNLNVASITPTTIVRDVNFFFGSEFGAELVEVNEASTPEPVSYLLTGGGIIALGVIRRCKRHVVSEAIIA